MDEDGRNTCAEDSATSALNLTRPDAPDCHLGETVAKSGGGHPVGR